ncbi:hypothetical protein H072_7475 [Dactylellina haptotyla CBS 200.50]|uniref:BZIP domain-containing protein n=1 Tax=Dactylellina haptotyla (strain CBS 200.50) TaxID=1284197 RepID=S8A717_DACHA|nr:hypothetical protein H072_7475 [Dactylellina haptotyla CBS 200.50]
MSHAYPPHSPASSSDSSDISDRSDRQHEDFKHFGQVSARNDHLQKSHAYGVMPHSQGSEMSALSSTAPSPEQRGSRALDVSKMLNPTPIKTDMGNGPNPRRRNADEAELDTPQRISNTPQQPPFTRSLPPSPTDRYDNSKMRDNSSYGTFPRNIKQPVPPSSKQRDGPLPMIEPHQPPNSAIGTPPRHSATLASPATMQQQGGFPFPPINGQPHHVQPSMATSPGTSPFSRGPPQSLSQGYGHGQNSPVYPMNPPFHEGHSASPMMHSLSQPSYASLHIPSLEGLTIPVDTTAASKLADEKRKRNAGASARFRQRRKEREREMSTRIVELETRLKVVEEERDHYRNLAMRYAGTPLPNTISTSLANNGQANASRHNNHGLQLSPRTMARANQQHVMNDGPYTSPAYAHVRGEETLGSPGIPLGRTLSTEGRRVGRAYSAGQVYPGGVPVGSEGPGQPLEPYIIKSRNGSLHHPRPQPIPEHLNGREQIKTEWGTR